MKIGKSTGGMNEIIEDLKKDMGCPDDDLIVVIHIPRGQIDRIQGALELFGYKGVCSTIRPIDNRMEEA